MSVDTGTCLIILRCCAHYAHLRTLSVWAGNDWEMCLMIYEPFETDKRNQAETTYVQYSSHAHGKKIMIIVANPEKRHPSEKAGNVTRRVTSRVCDVTPLTLSISVHPVMHFTNRSSSIPTDY